MIQQTYHRTDLGEEVAGGRVDRAREERREQAVEQRVAAAEREERGVVAQLQRPVEHEWHALVGGGGGLKDRGHAAVRGRVVCGILWGAGCGRVFRISGDQGSKAVEGDDVAAEDSGFPPSREARAEGCSAQDV